MNIEFQGNEQSAAELISGNTIYNLKGLDITTPQISQPAMTTNTDQIMEHELDRHLASRDIAQKMGVNDQTIFNHLQKTGYNKALMFGCRMV